MDGAAGRTIAAAGIRGAKNLIITTIIKRHIARRRRTANPVWLPATSPAGPAVAARRAREFTDAARRLLCRSSADPRQMRNSDSCFLKRGSWFHEPRFFFCIPSNETLPALRDWRVVDQAWEIVRR